MRRRRIVTQLSPRRGARRRRGGRRLAAEQLHSTRLGELPEMNPAASILVRLQSVVTTIAYALELAVIGAGGGGRDAGGKITTWTRDPLRAGTEAAVA